MRRERTGEPPPSRHQTPSIWVGDHPSAGWTFARLLLASALSSTGCSLVLVSDNNRYESGEESDPQGMGGAGGQLQSMGGDPSQGGAAATGGAAPGGADCGPSGPLDDPGSCGDGLCCGAPSPSCANITMPQVFTDLCEGDCATQPFHEDFASNPESRWGLRFRDNCNLESCVDGLVINPEPTDYWFHDANHDARAPMIHRRLCGSFAMVASVQVAGAPLAHNGAGLVVVHPGDDTRWVLLSHGFQDAAVLGSKVWPNGPSFTDGQAETLVAVNTGVVLSACRLASGEIYFHRFEPDDAGVMRVRPHPSQDEHYRLDDSCCLDVGLTGHMFTADGSTPHHLFHWVEITGDVQTIEDCAAFVDQARSLHP